MNKNSGILNFINSSNSSIKGFIINIPDAKIKEYISDSIFSILYDYYNNENIKPTKTIKECKELANEYYVSVEEKLEINTFPHHTVSLGLRFKTKELEDIVTNYICKEKKLKFINSKRLFREILNLQCKMYETNFYFFGDIIGINEVKDSISLNVAENI